MVVPFFAVPCPVGGYNYLSEGGGGEGKYYYSMHNGHYVVTSAHASISIADMDKVHLDCPIFFSKTIFHVMVLL